MAHLVLNQEEFTFVKHIFTRQVMHKERTSSREIRRKDSAFKLIITIKNKLDSCAYDENIKGVAIPVDRKSARSIQSFVNVYKDTIVTMLLPGYQERISKLPEDKKEEKIRLEEYRAKLDITVDICNNVLNKIGELL